MQDHCDHTLPEEPVQTCEGTAACRQTLPCPRSKKTGATVSQAKRRRTQQRLAQRILRPKPAADKRTGERDHPRHIMRHGLIRHRHRSAQTSSTRPNQVTNPTTPNIHTKAKTAMTSRAFFHQHGWRITGFRNSSFDVNTKKHECRAGLECKWLGRNVGTDEVKRVTRSSKIDVDIAMFVSKTRLSRRAYAFFKRWGESYGIQSDVVYLRELCPARA